MLRSASDADFAFLRGLAPAENEERLRAQIRDSRLFIIEHADALAGFIKFYVLWGRCLSSK